MKKVLIKRGIGIYEVEKCYELENNITTQYLIDNGFAEELDINHKCKSCEDAKKVLGPIEVVSDEDAKKVLEPIEVVSDEDAKKVLGPIEVVSEKPKK